MFLNLVLTVLPSFAYCAELDKPLTLTKDDDCVAIDQNSDYFDTLDGIMSISLANFQIKSQMKLIDVSRYILNSSVQYFYPKLVASTTSTYYESPTNSYTYSGTQYYKSLSTPRYFEYYSSITFNQNLLNLSQLSYIASQKENVKQQERITLRQLQSNALQASQLYNNIVQNYNTYLSTKKIAESYKIQAAANKLLYIKGEASLVDLLSAQSQQQLYEQQLLQTNSTLYTSIASLASLLNKRICNLTQPSYLGYPVTSELAHFSQSSLSEAIIISPNLNALKSSSKSSQELANYYKRSYIPSISAQAGMSGTYSRGNISGIGNQLNQYSNNTEPFVQLSLNWTIYDGGTNWSQAESQLATAKSFALQYDQGVEQLVNNYKSYIQIDSLNKQALQKAQSQLGTNIKLTNLIDIGYKSGVMTYLNYQVQATTLFNAYINYFSTQASLLNNRLQYYSLYLFRNFPKTSSVFSSFKTN